jgi:hypothetical protein
VPTSPALPTLQPGTFNPGPSIEIPPPIR